MSVLYLDAIQDSLDENDTVRSMSSLGTGFSPDWLSDPSSPISWSSYQQMSGEQEEPTKFMLSLEPAENGAAPPASVDLEDPRGDTHRSSAETAPAKTASAKTASAKTASAKTASPGLGRIAHGNGPAGAKAFLTVMATPPSAQQQPPTPSSTRSDWDDAQSLGAAVVETPSPTRTKVESPTSQVTLTPRKGQESDGKDEAMMRLVGSRDNKAVKGSLRSESPTVARTVKPEQHLLSPTSSVVKTPKRKEVGETKGSVKRVKQEKPSQQRPGYGTASQAEAFQAKGEEEQQQVRDEKTKEEEPPQQETPRRHRGPGKARASVQFRPSYGLPLPRYSTGEYRKFEPAHRRDYLFYASDGRPKLGPGRSEDEAYTVLDPDFEVPETKIDIVIPVRSSAAGELPDDNNGDGGDDSSSPYPSSSERGAGSSPTKRLLGEEGPPDSPGAKRRKLPLQRRRSPCPACNASSTAGGGRRGGDDRSRCEPRREERASRSIPESESELEPEPGSEPGPGLERRLVPEPEPKPELELELDEDELINVALEEARETARRQSEEAKRRRLERGTPTAKGVGNNTSDNKRRPVVGRVSK